ncbi:MAG: hypothetical protein K0S99_3330 [Thermomicrobiales bacterium]|nr:hypothetical protein [Thermomicrobiales bacterium]
MELGFVLIVSASAAAGLALRGSMSRRLGRVLLVLGIGSLAAAIGVLALVASGGRIVGFWTGGMIALPLLVIASLALPFAVAVSWGRSSG